MSLTCFPRKTLKSALNFPRMVVTGSIECRLGSYVGDEILHKHTVPPTVISKLFSFLLIQDPDWLSSVHKSMGTTDNATALRLLFYPPLPANSVIKPGQIRCGEHSDYGSVTLLFQDDVGGLEVS